MATKKRSPVWENFEFLEKDGVEDSNTTVCKLCSETFSYRTGSTSSMKAHLLRKHGITSETHGAKRSSKDAGKSESENSNTCSGQLKLSELFKAQNKLKFSSHRHADITRSIGIFIAKDLRPYSVVENEGFKVMLNSLEPRYEVPSRKHFAEKVIPKMYEESKAEVVQSLKVAPFIALTTDSWTSRATESYNTITAHFLNDWNLKSVVLQTRRMDAAHTGENLSQMLCQAVSEWDLKRGDKMPSLTTDNAANIVNAGKMAGFFPHIRCVAHTINLATQRGLQVSQMDRFLGRIRRVVTFFHKSTTAMAILRNKQVILELPQHKLIQDVTTRWNSTYDMVSRFLEQYPAIEATLQMKEVKKNAKEVNTLSDDDLANAESVMSVLEPLKTATTLLCGEVSPTVSLIHPLKHKLIQQLKVKDSDNSLAKAVKEAISKDLEPRYTESSIEQFLLQSSYLDPRFKSMPYLDKTEAQQILHTLTEKAATLTDLMHIKVEEEVNNNQDSLPSLPALLPDDGISMDTNATESQGASEARDSSVEEPPLKKTRSAMSELFGEVFVTKVEEAKPFEVRFEQEILDYKSEKNCSSRIRPPSMVGDK